VNGEKSVLIVTDGAEKVNKMAQDIAAVLEGHHTLIKEASAFLGTDLLPAEVLFIGCEEPSPRSFAYFEEVLQHINLAGRFLGVFSPNSRKAIQYLTSIVINSEAALNPKPLFGENLGDISKWAPMVLAGEY
jgi:hypothetical protein